MFEFLTTFVSSKIVNLFQDVTSKSESQENPKVGKVTLLALKLYAAKTFFFRTFGLYLL